MTQIFELQMHIGGYDDDTIKLETVGMFTTRAMAAAEIVKIALEGQVIRSAEIVEHAVQD